MILSIFCQHGYCPPCAEEALAEFDRYEILWREAESRRKANDNAACGYVPQEKGEDEIINRGI